MTDQGPRGLIPGQSMLRSRTPYGMTPGVRNVLPGINDGSPSAWNSRPPPEPIDLDAPIPNPPQPGIQAAADPAAAPGPSAGWELTDPDGNVVHMRSGAHKQRDAEQVQALGQALLNHATTDGDKAAAGRALDWGMAQVGKANAADITKQMAHMWDQGSNDDIKLELQGMRSKANHGGKGGVPNAIGPNGMPDPMTKMGHTFDKDLQALTSQVIQQERMGAKYAAMSELENTMAQMDQNLASGNSMAERVAVQQQLLALTGKASRESEQSAITGSAGKWEELKNKLSLWTSNDPNLSRAYVEKFKGMIAAERAAIRKQKEALGVQAATRIMRQAAGYGPDQAQEAADTVYGAMTGRSRGGSYVPPSDAEVSGGYTPQAAKRPAPGAPAAQPSAPPADNSDLF